MLISSLEGSLENMSYIEPGQKLEAHLMTNLLICVVSGWRPRVSELFRAGKAFPKQRDPEANNWK